MDLQRRIATGRGEFLLFALTPPRQDLPQERAQEIADVTERPFPFLPTMDPGDYLQRHLAAWDGPAVVYRVAGKHAESTLRPWLAAQDPDCVLPVFVGASSHDKAVAMPLARAQALREEVAPELTLGGVAIPERHTRRGDEHLRLLAKQRAGCSFFVTQVVYDVNAAKNLVSDYRYECAARGVAPVPIVFTFTVVGSLRTLEFLGWLGVDVPRWIRNDLTFADDTLSVSHDHALATAREIVTYCRRLDTPFGLNVESVSSRRAEIERSIGLAARLRAELRPTD